MGNALTRLRRACAELGFALVVVRQEGGQLLAEDVEPGGLIALAVVWDDDEGTVRRRVRQAMVRLGEGRADVRKTRPPMALAKSG